MHNGYAIKWNYTIKVQCVLVSNAQNIYNAKILCTVNTQDENLKKKTTKNEKKKERQGFL